MTSSGVPTLLPLSEQVEGLRSDCDGACIQANNNIHKYVDKCAHIYIFIEILLPLAVTCAIFDTRREKAAAGESIRRLNCLQAMFVVVNGHVYRLKWKA